MKELPILFSGATVRALLAGTKTQTRRVCKPAETIGLSFVVDCGDGTWGDEEGLFDSFACPYGQPGDRLWVRETWQAVRGNDRARHICIHPKPNVGWLEYAATPRLDEPAYKWRPSIHMPRWASRILLEVTEVRVERLQDISRGDAMAEGCPFPNMAAGDDPRKWYADLWDSLGGDWSANPWTWCVSFRVITPISALDAPKDQS